MDLSILKKKISTFRVSGTLSTSKILPFSPR